MASEASKTRTMLIIIAAALIFAGPTYVVFAFTKVAHIDYFISIGSGFALFIIGLALLLYLIRQKIVE